MNSNNVRQMSWNTTLDQVKIINMIHLSEILNLMYKFQQLIPVFSGGFCFCFCLFFCFTKI